MNKFLKNKDGSRQEVEIIYQPFLEEGGFNGKKKIIYDSPMALVKFVGMDIEKPWSYKAVPIKFLED